jgi:menaquinone-dependent protoporphyrinogen oxidase
MPTDTNIQRRVVLKRIVISLLGLGASAIGLAWWGTRSPEVTLIQNECKGGAAMKNIVLIVYASRAGSTGEVADSIARRLCELGFEVDVRDVGKVSSLDGYQSVVLGSAIRYGSWLPEMVRFIELHRDKLANMPTGLFTLHMQALDDSNESRNTRKKYLQAVHALLEAKAEAFFAGKIDPATLSFFERLAVKMVKSPVGDKRDWVQIKNWADTIAPLLQIRS